MSYLSGREILSIFLMGIVAAVIYFIIIILPVTEAYNMIVNFDNPLIQALW